MIIGARRHLPHNASLLSAHDPYDHKGALMYVVAVVSVYAMGIFFMIASHVRRRKDKREADHDIQVRQFLMFCLVASLSFLKCSVRPPSQNKSSQLMRWSSSRSRCGPHLV